MAGEVTLLEQARTIENPQAQKIVNVFAMEFIVNALMPYSGGVSGFYYPWTVMDVLPTVAPRDFNVDFTGDHGKSSNYALPWKNYGGKLQVDEALAKGNPTGALRQQLMQLQAIAKQWANHIFKGTGGVQVYGLDLFLANFFTGQIINGSSTTANGDLLTMAMMDDGFNKITKGPNTAIFCTQKVRDRLSYLARTNAAGQQNIFWAPDAFGNKVMTYNGVPVYTMIDPLSGADILPGTEIDGAAANNTTSSLYIVNFGEDEVHAFSPDPSDIMQVKVSTAEQNGTNFDITRIIKNAGVVMETPRAAVRIKFLREAVS
jgi:hypothetical protein